MKEKSQNLNIAGYCTKIVALLLGLIYVIFTLVENSSGLIVFWPWVLVWQLGLMFSCLWWLLLLWREQRIQVLGNGLDWFVLFLFIGLGVSMINAEFSLQSRWYLQASIGHLFALYALNQCLENKHKGLAKSYKWEHLLIILGYISLFFIVVSLYLWFNRTVIPEIGRLKELGEEIVINFGDIRIRNKFPIGHQNYVAGYLVLTLPLLVTLSYLQTGIRRWIWLLGIVLNLITLYTTASRGGWLGLLAMGVWLSVYWLLWSNLPRRILFFIQGLILVILIILVLANNRLLKLFSAVFTGSEGGEFAYRLIMFATSWRMGSAHPITGIGLGNVPLTYQNYRPSWAGTEAGIALQLHGTVAQLWAELGLWGIFVPLFGFCLLLYLGFRYFRLIRQDSALVTQAQQIWIASLYTGLFGYSIVSLTDYQLDNVCISGTLVIYLAVIASHFRIILLSPQKRETLTIFNQPRKAKGIVIAGFGLLMAVSVWLNPILRARQLSSQGFTALEKGDISVFLQSFEKAHQLAPLDPFYPYMLGWKWGELSQQMATPAKQEQLRNNSLYWFDQAIKTSPYLDFGYTSAAWLLLNNQKPQGATQDFAQAVRLLPGRKGFFYWLGLSLLEQGKVDLAVEAISLELLRHPIFLSSPVLQSPELKTLYPQVIEKVEAKYSQFLQRESNSKALTSYLHYNRGVFRWWQGNLAGAKEDLANDGTELTKILLLLNTDNNNDVTAQLSKLPPSPATLTISAWLQPEKREELLEKAWLMGFSQPPKPEKIKQLRELMANVPSFQIWLQQVPLWQQSRLVCLGFGVLMRHSEGPNPVEFLTFVDNLAIKQFFPDLFADPRYFPELDLILQPERDRLLEKIV